MRWQRNGDTFHNLHSHIARQVHMITSLQVKTVHYVWIKEETEYNNQYWPQTNKKKMQT